ncbi:hypothetical protein U879_03845 [Defluviimonas sp. 20V17]|uniref:Uncharacterized protein n=1 Tax=Allgaiera indica TaxID=765699 RepID=A0AAN5A2A5_9RHOB|nr:hypothetical protein [Allgaiera indica]KDB05006.1 hypothetical protein U879_03845 [Defluviimonas sp. 20V17]GHE05457.1 hypothetical protein GCM10008024_36300 [Allgaiera indica]SDX71731.1 hypothetical protein SAMN05444006_12615 [Allgaiera indica]
MLRLDIAPGPDWLTLAPGVRLFVVPLSTSVMLAARADIGAAGLPDDASADALSMAGAKAIARRVVLDWEGVGDADGTPVALTPESIDALLDIWPIFEAFQIQYVGPGMLLEQEKNGSAPSPTGTSAGAPATARPARKPAKTARRG